MTRRILLIVLVCAAAASSDAVAQGVADAYLNEEARELVRLARERRNLVDRRIHTYETTVNERISVRLRAGIAAKLAYRRETAASIEWRRDGPIRIDVLGMREGSGLSRSAPSVPNDLSAELLRLAFDPADPDLLMRLDTVSIRHPLRPGSEEHYRFQAGDSTAIRLPDGRAVRLRELRIIPRRRVPALIDGSFWLDTETHAVVQAYFRLARGLDADRNPRSISAAALTSFLKPLRAELEFVAVEYGLWDLQWWLPRLVAAQGLVQAGRFYVPLTYERTYTDYAVQADAVGAPVARPDTLPARCRETVRYVDGRGDAALDSIRQAVTDAERERRARVEARVREARGDTLRVGDCEREFHIAAPADSALIHSVALPPTLFGDDIELVAAEELRAIRARVRAMPGAPASLERPLLQWPLRGPGLLRYNRIEGLSAGARVLFDPGPLALTAEARFGVADRALRGELGFERRGAVLHTRLAGYRRLQPTPPVDELPGTLASLGALLTGRDDLDYFDAWGADVVLRPAESRAQWFDVRVYGERQRAVTRNTDFSVAHVLDSDRLPRANVAADDADQLGVRVRLRRAWGLDPAAPRLAGEAALGAETGDFTLLRPEALVQATAPLGRGLDIGVEGAAGTIESSAALPAQAFWRLGGAPTLRGYDGSSLVGERYWRARAELGLGRQVARLAVFSDAAWAGPRTRFDATGMLSSAGAGISVADGALRLDVARGVNWFGTAGASVRRGWRLHLYFDGLM